MVNKASKLYENFVRELEAQGCHVRSTDKGWFVLPPRKGSKPIILHGSPSSKRWYINTKRDVERAGLVFPKIGEKFK